MTHTAAHWGSYRVEESGTSTPSLAPVAGDPSPSLIGKGWLSAMTDPNSRIARPAVREGWLNGRDRTSRCNDRFVEVEWDTALDLVAEEITRIRDAHGNQAIFAGSYGWASAGRFHHAQSHLRRFMNLVGGYTTSRHTYSHGAAEAFFPFITGMSNDQIETNVTSLSLVAEQCELLLSFGGISGRTAQIASSGTSTHEVEHVLAKAAARGMKIIGITPVRSDLEDLPGAEWWAIRPGTDTALMLALAYEIMIEDRHDTAFLDRCTDGFDTFAQYLRGTQDGIPKTADWAADICDLDAQKIRTLSRQLTEQKSMVSLTWGMQRADHGEQPLWAGLALAAMTGGIGKPGTGFAFGYGSTTPVGRDCAYIPRPSLKQGQNPISDYIPVARIADALLHPGETYPFEGKMRTYPDLRMVMWAGGNPFHHHQDLFRLEQAWCKPETVIVLDHAWTATARRADIVLPATSALEREDIMMNRRDPAMVHMAPVIPRYAEAKDDYEIFTGLADRLGVADAYTEGRSVEDWLRKFWDDAGARAKRFDIELPDFDTFRSTGFHLPDGVAAQRILFEDFVRDPDANKLKTESGKLQLSSPRIAALGLADCPGHPCWLPPTEGAQEVADGGLHLVSPQPRTRLHGQLDTGAVSVASKIQGREPCYIHPETAARLGLSAGDVALLENKRGACLAGVVLDDGLRPDCISLPTGAWFDPQEINGRRIDVHGNPNALTLDKGTSALGQGNIAHTTVVHVSPWNGPLPEVRTRRLPDFV